MNFYVNVILIKLEKFRIQKESKFNSVFAFPKQIQRRVCIVIKICEKLNFIKLIIFFLFRIVTLFQMFLKAFMKSNHKTYKIY